MSQENVKLVRQVYDAAARYDAETVFALYDPEVEWDNSTGLGGITGRGVYHGHEGFRHFFREWREAWEYPEDVPEELFDAGEHVSLCRDRPKPWAREWGRDRVDSMRSLDDPGGQDRPGGVVPDARRGPPSRRAAGVGG